MMQCGMFVPAAQFEGSLYRNIFTHFTRREDQSMNSGRLDEELRRMDAIVRHVTKDSLVLLNESFATTTEKEGSVIALELVYGNTSVSICKGTICKAGRFHGIFKRAEKGGWHAHIPDGGAGTGKYKFWA